MRLQLWLFIISGWSLCFIYGCKPKTTQPPPKLSVIIDEKMELLTTAQYLAEDPLLTRADIQYKKEIERNFRPFVNHPVVSLLKAVVQEDYFTGSAAPWYLYQFSFPDFEPIGIIQENENQIEHYEARKDTLTRLLTLLKDFYYSTRFHDFFLKHKEFYDSVKAPVAERLSQTDLPDLLEQHYGEKRNSYTIVLCPLLHDGGYGLQVHTAAGQDIYGLAGPAISSREIPVFNPEQILTYYVIHEFSHSFCNPYIAANIRHLLPDSCLINPISKTQIELGYGADWETCLYEHLVRANELVLAEKIVGPEKTAAMYTDYKAKKWIYLDGLIALIKKRYLVNRNMYPRMADLMPEIIEYFHEEKKKRCLE